MSGSFASFERLPEGWYPAMRPSALRPGRVMALDLPPLRLALYRDTAGKPHAVAARCPHLGADLAGGDVTADGLRCAYHHFVFGPDGQCLSAPGYDTPPNRCARAFPVNEQDDMLWVWAGDSPNYALPGAPTGQWRRWCLRPQRLRCHPHLILGNGLDEAHYSALHHMRPLKPATLRVPAAWPDTAVALELNGEPSSPWLRRLVGAHRRPIDATFTTIGPSLAWLEVRSPDPFHVYFTARPTADRHAVTQVTLYLPRHIPAAMRCVVLIGSLLHDDRRVLESLEFQPAFASGDGALRRYAETLDRLPCVTA